MPQTSYFKISKNAAAEHDKLSLSSSLKRWQLYDKETSVSFFYSEIEGCWLLRVNNGSCRIDDQIVYSHSENAIVVEKSVNMVINGTSFRFTNLGHSKGISKMLVHTLLKRTNFRVKMDTVLGLIYENCNCYLDFYFVLDAIRKNRMFVYRCDEIMLDVESLYFDISRGKSPITESLKYEAENRVLRDKIKAFNIAKIWTSSDFERCDSSWSDQSEKWPTSKTLQILIERGEGKVEAMRVLTPSPQSSCRYINSYQIKRSGTAAGDSKDELLSEEGTIIGYGGEEYVDRECLKSSFLQDDEREEKRRPESIGKKRPKLCFNIPTSPVEEAITGSSDSEYSVTTCASDALQTNRPKKLHYRSASCVEDGFLCERYDDSMYVRESSRRNRHGGPTRQGTYRINKP